MSKAVGVPLRDWDINIYRGILTGLNEAFIISGEKKDELIAADPKPAEIIRPILRGRDIKRYGYTFADLWLIVAHNGVKGQNRPRIKIEDYPAVKAHLDQYYAKLARRADKGDTPYNLRNCIYMDDFSKPRIVYREISDAMDACLVEPEVMINNKCYMVSGKHLIYLLTFFNSKLFNKILLQQANITGGKGEAFLKNIRLPLPNHLLENYIGQLYSEYSNPKNSRDSEQIATEIDQHFCSVFGLTTEEQLFIMHCRQLKDFSSKQPKTFQ